MHINHPCADTVAKRLSAKLGNAFIDDDLDRMRDRDVIPRFDAAEMWNGGSGFLDTMYYYGSRAFRPFEGMDKAFRKWFDLLDTGAHFPSIGKYNYMIAEVRRRFLGLLPPIPIKIACRLMGSFEAGLIYKYRRTARYGLENTALLPGTPRTYVYTGGELSAEALAEGVRAGRSFVTSAPLIFMTLEGRMPGETAAAGKTALLRLDIRCHKPLANVILIADGRKLRTIPLKGSLSWQADLALPLARKK